MDQQEEAVVCPWCQSEIVWDPVLGPEETCPYCSNELTDYRSLHIELERNDEAQEIDKLHPVDRYKVSVKEWLGLQEDGLECPYCQETMMYAGLWTVTKDSFQPHVVEPIGQPFLPAPFAIKTFVCPSCFKVEWTLSDADRIRMANILANAQIVSKRK